MKTKAILFDLDNTMLDFMGMKREASRKAAEAMIKAGLEGEAEELSRKLFDFYLEYGIESDDAFEKYLVREFGEAHPRILAAAINAYLKEKYLHLKPYPGVPETLRELKDRGYKLGLVSDGLRLKAWMRLNETKLDKYFDVVVTHEDTGKMKPNPEPFTKACKKLNVKPEECLFIGDWPERDIEGAKAVGMKTCLAKYGKKEETKKTDYFIGSIKEIMNIIKK